jgi:hypothetical protein
MTFAPRCGFWVTDFTAKLGIKRGCDLDFSLGLG